MKSFFSIILAMMPTGVLAHGTHLEMINGHAHSWSEMVMPALSLLLIILAIAIAHARTTR